jgi:preprotein translocase subunit SecD
MTEPDTLDTRLEELLGERLVDPTEMAACYALIVGRARRRLARRRLTAALVVCSFFAAAVFVAVSAGRARTAPDDSASTGNRETLTFHFGPPTPQRSDMETARAIVANRFAALGFPGVVVDLDPARQLLTLRLPNAHRPSDDTARLMTHTAELRFRLVQEAIPYAGASAVTNASNATCRDGAAVTPDRPAQPVILPDKDKQLCYLLGPTLLTGRNIGSAAAVVNTSSGQWQVDVHFKDNDFVSKVATPDVGKQVAIVLDGVVQSAPTIQEGISGQNVTITGSFSEKEAQDLALVLRYGSLPVHLQFVGGQPATG